jgi:thioredoxin 1
MPIAVHAENFAQEVLRADQIVLVDFWGPQCGPCLALSPHGDKLEEVYGDKLKVTKLDASKNRRFCLSLKVLGLPTFLIYEKGKEVRRLSGGDLKMEEIEKAIKEVIK